MKRVHTLSQAAGFVSGRLTGLAYTDRYDGTQLSSEVRTELMEIAQTLNDAVKDTEKTDKKTAHSTK